MQKNKIIQLLNADNQNILGNVVIADSFLSRLTGLMGKNKLNVDTGLLIRPCNSIHTFFMKINIDVIFIDKNYKVLEIYKNMLPWKISKIHRKSILCIEGNSGCFKNIIKGEIIKIIEKA